MVTVEGITTTHQCWDIFPLSRGFAILIPGYSLDPYVPSLTPMSINKMHVFPGSPSCSVVKNPSAKQEMGIRFLGREDPLEKEMATHSSILAWEIPWTEEPGVLQSMGSQRVRHNLAIQQQQHTFPGGKVTSPWSANVQHKVDMKENVWP